MPRVRRGDVVWVEPRLVAQVEFVRVDARGAPACTCLPRVARGQACFRGAQGASVAAHGAPRGAAGAAAEQPGQAVLAGRGDHEGRPRRVLPRRRRGARAAPEGPAVHDEAVSRRLAGEAFLPEAGAVPHARVDQACAVCRSTREGEKKVIDYALVDDELALLWMANMGCIDMHVWSSRADRPERRTGSCSTSTRPRTRASTMS